MVSSMQQVANSQYYRRISITINSKSTIFVSIVDMVMLIIPKKAAAKSKKLEI